MLWELADVVEQIFTIACTENLYPTTDDRYAAAHEYQAEHQLTYGMQDEMRSNLVAMRDVEERACRIKLMPAELQSGIPGVPDEYGLRASTFVDAGSVFGYKGPTTFSGQTAQIANANIVRSSAGAGLTWASPFGPLTASYAVPLSKAAYDVVRPFNFSAGPSF